LAAGEQAIAIDSLECPLEGREERRIERGREVAWTPKVYD